MKTAIEILYNHIPAKPETLKQVRTGPIVAAMEEYADQFKTLIQKYINHIIEIEGVDFITTGNSSHTGIEFTADEMDILK